MRGGASSLQRTRNEWRFVAAPKTLHFISDEDRTAEVTPTTDTFHDARQYYEIDAICHFRLGTRQTSVTSSKNLKRKTKSEWSFDDDCVDASYVIRPRTRTEYTRNLLDKRQSPREMRSNRVSSY